MKKLTLSLVSLTSLALISGAWAEESAPVKVPVTPTEQTAQATPSVFNPDQVAEIEKVVGEYLAKNPELVMISFQLGMAKQQAEALEKTKKAVQANKDKIFNDPSSPVLGNAKGTETLVVFTDPNCHFCHKSFAEVEILLKKDKDVKVIYQDIPLMGPDSMVAVKALWAANEQGKYQKLQKALYTSKNPINEKEILKLAAKVGLDMKKFKAAMKSKAVEEKAEAALKLAQDLGISGTPTLIIGEETVHSGFMEADSLGKALKEASAAKSPADETQQTTEETTPHATADATKS